MVEHLERELSRREASERGLARELDAARADIAERDAQIEDICAQWERSVTQMQAARDEDVRRVSERLAFVERAEVPALRAQMEQCETRLMRAQASAESLAAKLERAEAEVRSLAADGERRDAIAAAEAAAAARESDALARDAERRRETELAALRARFERVRGRKSFFDIERERTRKNVDAVVAGAADESFGRGIAGGGRALDSNRIDRSRGETDRGRIERAGEGRRRRCTCASRGRPAARSRRTTGALRSPRRRRRSRALNLSDPMTSFRGRRRPTRRCRRRTHRTRRRERDRDRARDRDRGND